MTTLTRLAATIAALLLGSPAFAQEGSVTRGEQVAGTWCVECHATGAAARAADVGPPFQEIARTRSDDYLRGFLANPHLRGLMPPFELTTAHTADMVAYIRSLE